MRAWRPPSREPRALNARGARLLLPICCECDSVLWFKKKKKSDSKSLSSTDNAMLVTLVATAHKHESSDELRIFAIAVGGSVGSGNGAPVEIVELMVDSGAAVTTCLP